MSQVAHRQPQENKVEKHTEKGSEKSIAINEAAASAYDPGTKREQVKTPESAKNALPSATIDAGGISFAAPYRPDISPDAQHANKQSQTRQNRQDAPQEQLNKPTDSQELRNIAKIDRCELPTDSVVPADDTAAIQPTW